MSISISFPLVQDNSHPFPLLSPCIYIYIHTLILSVTSTLEFCRTYQTEAAPLGCSLFPIFSSIFPLLFSFILGISRNFSHKLQGLNLYKIQDLGNCGSYNSRVVMLAF
ncbi:hypothetical protein RchiOBHm_Chr3g0472571 [Rosa chinensis]|uniref:Uncharacterized protein n=1 Tax=Rosa chinensis TaxID=74649 RepID=A0A2P6RBM2_ROSCH|nr:hypothetical protein RchiOBHm_Chr3g0472571 [Rosa chinensis]